MNVKDAIEVSDGIPERAVMECFYGPLWDAESRASVMRWAALHGATSYVYGPAADPHTGAGWRDPLASHRVQELTAVVETAHSLGLSVTWRVSPSAPLQRENAMRLGDADELSLLRRHVSEVLRLGFDRVLVAFDDIDGRLDSITESRFGGEPHPLAAAQTHVLNAVDAHVRNEGATLLVCPTQYWGTKPSEYRRRFGDLLGEGIPVCWTGPRVVSPTIRGQDAARVREQYQHDLWLWDNYPVNDWEASGDLAENTLQPHRLPLRPLAGREHSLATAVVGYGANAALLPYSGMPALATAMDWARNPAAYDPAESHARALANAASIPESLAVMADACGPSAGGLQEASSLQRAVGVILAQGGLPDPSSLGTLRKVALDHIAATDQLQASSEPICAEIRPWTNELARACEAALRAADVLEHLHGADEDALDRAVLALRGTPPPARDITLASGVIEALVDHVRGAAGIGLGSLTEYV